MSLMKIKDLFHFEKGVLQSSKCIPGEFDFITASSEWKSHNEYTHDCEALIFAAAASGSLGRTHYVKGKFISSDLCFIITPKDQKKYPIDLKFYHLIFQTLKDEIVRNTKAGTSKEAIGLTVFGNYELPYFDIAKQIETKEKFVQAQKPTIGLSTELTHQLALVKQLRQSFLREAMQGKLTADFRCAHPELIEGENSAQALLEKLKAEKKRLITDEKLKKEKELPPIKEEEIPFEIPESWVWCRLNDIITMLGDGIHGTPNYDSQGDYYFINGNNLIDGKIEIKENTKKVSDQEYEKYKKDLTNNTIFVSINGTLGNIAYYNKEKVILGKSACYFNLMSEIEKYYIGYYVKSSYFFKYAVDVASETTIKNVSLKSMRLLPLPLPPLSEQQAIVSKLDKLMRTCDELETSIRTNQQQNEMLLQQVLREALEG